MYQQQPRALSVLHMRDSAEQRLVFLGHSLQLPPHEFWMSMGAPNTLIPCRSTGIPPAPHNRFRIAQPGDSFQLVTCLWPLTCGVPHFRLASMNCDLRVSRPTRWKCDRACHRRKPRAVRLLGATPANNNGINGSPFSRLRTRMEIRRTSAQTPGHHLPTWLRER